MLLCEQIDRLSRLNDADWKTLEAQLLARSIRVVALDLPTSWTMARDGVDETTLPMFEAVNSMLLDALAAVARKDYSDRRRRQAQGIAKAKSEPGKYRGRVEDAKRNAAIVGMLSRKDTWSSIVAATGCSRSTLSRLSKRVEPPPTLGAAPRPMRPTARNAKASKPFSGGSSYRGGHSIEISTQIAMAAEMRARIPASQRCPGA
jgi:DNA invertase Pin-like site-specific DNA recombinase